MEAAPLQESKTPGSGRLPFSILGKSSSATSSRLYFDQAAVSGLLEARSVSATCQGKQILFLLFVEIDWRLEGAPPLQKAAARA